MADNRRALLTTQPSMLDFGSTYVGATIRGSLQVLRAASCDRYHGHNLGDGAFCANRPVPDWIDFKGPTKTLQGGLAWTIEVRTDKPGHYRTSVDFECDTGLGHCLVTLQIKEGQPRLADLVFCDSPFDCHTTNGAISSLARILGALPFRLHCLDPMAELGDLQPKAIVLHQGGLLWCKPDQIERLQSLIAGGVNLLVLADEFYDGTTGAANRIIAPFGLRMKQSGADEPGLTRDEKLQRLIAWQTRYEHAPFDSGPEHIYAHPLTEGVKRIHWFRPCPVICADRIAQPLVRNPAAPEECFAAVAKPGGYVVAVGKSLWSGLACVGWPYDNDRFLANILAGGDAEAAVGAQGPSTNETSAP